MDTVDNLREPIAASWRRAARAGLDPASALDGITYGEVDRASRLMAAAGPVLDELHDRLGGTRYSTVLVGRDGRTTQLWCGDDGTRRAFDGLGIDVGASLLEENIGTNAPGTVLEARTGVMVHGREHFAEPLRRFSCYGHPIVHPLNRRIEGVLDLSALADEASSLLPPLVVRAIADIEQRLLDGSRVSEQALFAAFQAASTHRRATVAIGADVLMSNQAASDLLGTTDITLLRTLAADVRRYAFVGMTLESGQEIRVEANLVDGTGGVLLHLTPGRARSTISIADPPTEGPLLVCGPPGSGRTTAAREHAPQQPVTVINATDALLDGAHEWARNFTTLIRGGRGTVCVDGLDVLPDVLLDLVAQHVDANRPPRLLLVSGPVEGLTGRAAALAGQCLRRVTLPSLASRPHEIPQLVRAMLRQLGADPGLHLTPGALRALSAHDWPGNLRELHTVLEYTTRRRRTGGVVVEDLPEAYRAMPARSLALRERAERQAIIEALRANDGNKVRAAKILGISRTTLYARMRALRIEAP